MEQDDALASVTRLVRREDGKIDWGLSAWRVERMARAYSPVAGGVHDVARVCAEGGEARGRGKAKGGGDALPGQVVTLTDSGIGVRTGDGVLELRRVQLAGRAAADARDFARGYRDFVGSQLGE